MPDFPLRTIRSFVRREGRLTDGQKRVLHADNRYLIHWEPDQILELDSLFNPNATRILEIGFGNGTSLAQMAQDNPNHCFVGVEVHRPGVGRLLLEIEKRSLDNVRALCTDAMQLVRSGLKPNSIDRVQIYFPDPWHKKRHNKRRIIQESFMTDLAQIIRVGGVLHLATDWEPYAEQMLAVLSDHPLFQNQYVGYAPRPDYRPLTKFELRGQRLGHGVFDLLFERCQKV